MSNSDFYSIGNLAFYDGWSPNYVYFSSLLKYANTISDDHHGGWNPDAAMRVAYRAASDAQQNVNQYGVDDDSALMFFERRF